MELLETVKALASLAHETRLGIFRLLVQAGSGGLAVGQINEAIQIPAPTLSFHLKELSHAGLVSSRQEGRFVYYTANYDVMNGLVSYLTENCCQGTACISNNFCNKEQA